MKIKIISPRLDVPFKDHGQPIPQHRSPISPIRAHWANFVNQLEENLQKQSHSVDIVERVVWQISEEDFSGDYDEIYVPHRLRKQFEAVPENVYFYMQTVFPHLFSVDSNGWGASISWIDGIDLVSPLTQQERVTWDFYQNRALRGTSKFDQPISGQFTSKDYVLFVCQIPHDETIKYHSDVEVIDALRATLEYAKLAGKQCVVKGHPVNPEAMEAFRALTSKYNNATYRDDISITDALKGADGVFLVNSGVGFEAMFFDKPIFRFGDAEYRNVIPMVSTDPEEIESVVSIHTPDLDKYKKFSVRFINRLINT